MNIQITETIESTINSLVRKLSAEHQVRESEVIAYITSMLGDPQPGDAGFVPFMDNCACTGEDFPIQPTCPCQD